MLIIISLFILICVATLIAIIRSKRPIKEVLNEARFELVTNIIGAKALVEDFMTKGINKADIIKKTGKFALITGGCRGIGVEVIKMLLKCDLHIIIGCRNVEAALNLLAEARKEGITTGDIRCYALDVSSLQSVREFAKQIKDNYSKLHLLINNAGVMYVPFSESVDGYESQFATNYLGHFLLAHLLLPLLKEGGEKDANARIVNMSSCAHTQGVIDFDDINSTKKQYIALRAYAQSKLAQVLYTIHLNKMLEGSNIQVHAVHPGVVDTGLFDGTIIKVLTPWAIKLVFKKPIEGAQPVLFACTSPSLEGKGGSYISNCRVVSPSNSAQSEKLQQKLFEFTNKILSIDEYGRP